MCLFLCLLTALFWTYPARARGPQVVRTNLGTCTGGDYTVFMDAVPGDCSDLVALKRDLARFFEAALSSASPVTRAGPVEVDHGAHIACLESVVNRVLAFCRCFFLPCFRGMVGTSRPDTILFLFLGPRSTSQPAFGRCVT